jgi:hypothetical protein
MINNLYIKATPTTASVTWGDITGTLSDQTDLQSALDAKFDEPTGTVSEYLRGDGSLATFPSLTGYVPYTGATADVDLGTHTLSAKDLVINHSSGSGVAASITKGGAGEALTVNKTSGSGNAMSVTGGVTQLSELHLTTDLADAYIASAATWNGKQDALTLTTTGTSGAATLVGSTLNIPQYSGGGGSGIHAQKTIVSQQWTNLWTTYSTAPTTSVATSNRLYCMPFFPNQTFTCDALAINVTTLSVGGLAKILIYSDVNGVPTTKLYESANLDCSTIGQKTASTSFTFNAGTTYWLGFIANNSLNSFTFMQQSSIYGFSTSGAFTASTNGFLSTTFSATPTTLTALTYATGNVPMISIRKA